jgi:26S proteasome regulatory subunit N12
LPLKDAATLLFFPTQSELQNFAKEVRVFSAFTATLFRYPGNCLIQSCMAALLTYISVQRGWQINLMEGTITFARKSEEKAEIPKEKLIAQSLAYARELEQIV